MTDISPGTDPLNAFPPEVVLRVLEFTPVTALASLTAVSQAWHHFIDVTHQDTIYGSESKTSQPPGGSHNFEFLADVASFSKFFEGTTSWKDLCKRQTLLARNWAKPCPSVRESILQVGNDSIWRFRPDFKRRFFVSTSHAGGLNVTDMDTGRILWRLPSTLVRDEYAVRPFAHLEYQDGMAVFDREGDAVEVWQADQEGAMRGEFRRIAILNHDCQTRGFQLSYWTLCVVSNQGQGFVYDMTQRPPKLITHLKIARGAVGHLDQSGDVVIYSIGPQGYHVYDKVTGACLGVLHPSHCTDKYHINHPSAFSDSANTRLAEAFAQRGPSDGFHFPAIPRNCSLLPIELGRGPLPPPADPTHVRHGEDEWGAGMLHGDLFVGFSRAGRVFVCSNWRKAIHDPTSLAKHSSLIECESDGATFDLGGWLSVRNHRIMFEIGTRIYVVALDDENKIQDVERPARASYSLVTSSAPQLAIPVSFMTLCDDAILTNFSTLCWRQSLSDIPGNAPQPQLENAARIFQARTIRVINLAPDPTGNMTSTDAGASEPNIDLQRAAGRATGTSLPAFAQLAAMVGHVEGNDRPLEAFLGGPNDGEMDDDEWDDVNDLDDDEQGHAHGGAFS